jgi:hypothetical protein
MCVLLSLRFVKNNEGIIPSSEGILLQHRAGREVKEFSAKEK